MNMGTGPDQKREMAMLCIFCFREITLPSWRHCSYVWCMHRVKVCLQKSQELILNAWFCEQLTDTLFYSCCWRRWDCYLSMFLCIWLIRCWKIFFFFISVKISIVGVLIYHQGVRVWWCVTITVVSENPRFLSNWTNTALQGGLLVWPTNLLVITHLPVSKMDSSHAAFSQANALTLSCPSHSR